MLQCLEIVIVYIVVFKVGVIIILFFILFGEEVFEFRFKDFGIKVVIIDVSGVVKLEFLCNCLLDLIIVLCVDGVLSGVEDFYVEMNEQVFDFMLVDISLDDLVIIIYILGIIGQFKGVLYGYRVLFGYFLGVEMSYDFFGQLGDWIWILVDWVWIGGLFDVLMLVFYFGVLVVVC